MIKDKKEGDTIYIIQLITNATKENIKRAYFLLDVANSPGEVIDKIDEYYKLDSVTDVDIFECEIKKITKPWS
jgi:hypothetical protein